MTQDLSINKIIEIINVDKINNEINYNEYNQNIENDKNDISNSNFLYKIYLDVTNKKNVINMDDENSDEKFVNEIPPVINDVLDKKYYIYSVNRENCFISSILTIFDKMFTSLSHNSQLNYIKNFKKKLAYDLDEKNYYKKFKFKPNIIKKTDFQKILFDEININSHIEMYISYYLNINILIIDLDNSNIYFLCNYDKNIITIIIFKKDNYYNPLLNENKQSIFCDEIIIGKLFKKFNKQLNIEEINNSNKSYNSNPNTNKTDIDKDLEISQNIHSKNGDDSNKNGDDSNTNGDDSNTNGDDSNINGDDSNINGDDSNINGDDSNTNGDDSNTNGDDSNTNGDDSNTNGDDSNTNGDDPGYNHTVCDNSQCKHTTSDTKSDNGLCLDNNNVNDIIEENNKSLMEKNKTIQLISPHDITDTNITDKKNNNKKILKNIRYYKLEELQILCTSHNIPIHNDNHKKLKKKDLYDKLILII